MVAFCPLTYFMTCWDQSELPAAFWTMGNTRHDFLRLHCEVTVFLAMSGAVGKSLSVWALLSFFIQAPNRTGFTLQASQLDLADSSTGSQAFSPLDYSAPSRKPTPLTLSLDSTLGRDDRFVHKPPFVWNQTPDSILGTASGSCSSPFCLESVSLFFGFVDSILSPTQTSIGIVRGYWLGLDWGQQEASGDY